MDRITGLGIDAQNALAKTYTSSDFRLARTHSAHMSDGAVAPKRSPNSFKDLLFESLDEASATVNNHEQLRTQAIIDPDSVNSHDVTLAGLKATTSVQMVSAVVSRALEAYRAIIALR